MAQLTIIKEETKGELGQYEFSWKRLNPRSLMSCCQDVTVKTLQTHEFLPAIRLANILAGHLDRRHQNPRSAS